MPPRFDTPEAQFNLGDSWFHFGNAFDHAGYLARARELMERSAAVDSQANTLRHLIEIAVHQRDTAILRRLMPAFARTEDPGRWRALFLGWSILGEEMQLAALRQRPDTSASIGALWPYVPAMIAAVPQARLEELHDQVMSTTRSLATRWNAIS